MRGVDRELISIFEINTIIWFSSEVFLSEIIFYVQVNQLAQISQKYQNSQNGGAGVSAQDLQTNCHLWVYLLFPGLCVLRTWLSHLRPCFEKSSTKSMHSRTTSMSHAVPVSIESNSTCQRSWRGNEAFAPSWRYFYWMLGGDGRVEESGLKWICFHSGPQSRNTFILGSFGCAIKGDPCRVIWGSCNQFYLLILARHALGFLLAGRL